MAVSWVFNKHEVHRLINKQDSLLHELRVGPWAADGGRRVDTARVVVDLARRAAVGLVGGRVDGHDAAAVAAEGAALGLGELLAEADYFFADHEVFGQSWKSSKCNDGGVVFTCGVSPVAFAVEGAVGFQDGFQVGALLLAEGLRGFGQVSCRVIGMRAWVSPHGCTCR